MRPNQSLKKFREAKGYSQSELAEQLGCSTSFVSKAELGDRRLGLESAMRLEDLTQDWDEGPIRAREWLKPLRRAS